MNNDHVHPVFAAILNEHGPKSVAAHTLAAAVDNAELHAAKHDEHFGPVLRESDASAIDAALRSDRSADSIEAERRARRSLEAAQAKLRGLPRIIDPSTPGYADAKLRAQANVDTWTRRVAWYVQKYGTAAVVALLLVLPAMFPAKFAAPDTTNPTAPHDAGKHAPSADAWGGAGPALLT